MEILIAGLVAVVGFGIVIRFLGTREARLLAQYEELAKRFRLETRTHRSRWGKGIRERVSLHGEYRGYTIALYSHYHGKGKERIEWTSLTLEALFAGELEMRVSFAGTQDVARFAEKPGLARLVCPGFEAWSDDARAGTVFSFEGLDERIGRLAGRDPVGAISLSKGFLEYREVGTMQDAAMRERFQEALLVLGGLGDALSLYAAEKAKSVTEL